MFSHIKLQDEFKKYYDLFPPTTSSLCVFPFLLLLFFAITTVNYTTFFLFFKQFLRKKEGKQNFPYRVIVNFNALSLITSEVTPLLFNICDNIIKSFLFKFESAEVVLIGFPFISVS